MSSVLTHQDLQVFAADLTPDQAAVIIADLEALTAEVCDDLLSPDFKYRASVVAILRQAALRWHRVGGGGGISSTQMTSGAFSFSESYDTGASGAGRLYPSEVSRLRALCRRAKGETQGSRKAYTYLPGRGIL